MGLDLGQPNSILPDHQWVTVMPWKKCSRVEGNDWYKRANPWPCFNQWGKKIHAKRVQLYQVQNQNWVSPTQFIWSQPPTQANSRSWLSSKAGFPLLCNRTLHYTFGYRSRDALYGLFWSLFPTLYTIHSNSILTFLFLQNSHLRFSTFENICLFSAHHKHTQRCIYENIKAS